jgi:hypothetical protein
MGKKTRRIRNSRAAKTLERRRDETRVLRKQIEDLGLGEGNPDIARLFGVLDTFVDTGEGWTGKIPLYGHGRVADVILSTRDGVSSSVCLAKSDC